MYICSNCGQAYSTYTVHCPKCGGLVNTFPSSHVAPPAIPGSVKAKGIVGMSISIEAIVGSVISLFYAFIALSFMGYSRVNVFAPAALFVSIFHIAASIVGRVLSSSSESSGFVCGITRTGKILGLISIIISACALFLSFISIS